MMVTKPEEHLSQVVDTTADDSMVSIRFIELQSEHTCYLGFKT
jgi:hypothetical protein